MRQSEHQLVRVQALEKELDRQLGISDEQRRQVRAAGQGGRGSFPPGVGFDLFQKRSGPRAPSQSTPCGGCSGQTYSMTVEEDDTKRGV